MTDSPFDFHELLCALPKGRPVAVAVSGGPDSMSLCHMLSRCAGDAVHALTVDHGLRPESAAEAREVGRRIKGWPAVRHEILTCIATKDIGASRVQEMARRDRYALMAAYCRTHGIDELYVAHHRDDQAETFLFRLAKGSGLDGLGAMRARQRYDDGLTIVRPLLGAAKVDLLDYCRENDIDFICDPSNEKAAFARVRLRMSSEVLAREGLTAKRLAVTAERLARARAALDHYAQNLFASTLRQRCEGRLAFDYQALCAAPEETRLRVLILAMEEVTPDAGYGPRMERVEALCRRLFAPAGGDVFKGATLGGCRMRLQRKPGLLLVERQARQPI